MPENMQNMKAEFELRFPGMVDTASTISDTKLRAEKFTDVMSIARQFEMTDRVIEYANKACREHNLPPLWEMPVPFEKEPELEPFPMKALPGLLAEFVQAVCENAQVYPEMAVLPLLCSLSACVLGKGQVLNPGSFNCEQLALYGLTVAESGNKKSACQVFWKPIDKYQFEYNEQNALTFKQINTALQAKVSQQNALIKKGESEQAQRLDADILKIKEQAQQCRPLHMLIDDATPESIARTIYDHNGSAAILSDEPSVFDAFTYAKSANINVLLKGYDGSSYYQTRIGREPLFLKNPLVAVGVMAQPEVLQTLMQNTQYVGRGLLQRFIFAFPRTNRGYSNFSSPPIPADLSERYASLIERLLAIPRADQIPIISSDGTAACIYRDYFDHVQIGMRPGGKFENVADYFSKQYGKMLRIAGVLHFAKHLEKAVEMKIDAETAQAAVSIARWSESQALKAFGETVGDTVDISNAKYIVSRFRKTDKALFTKSEFQRFCRGKSMSVDEQNSALDVLEEHNFIKREFIQRSSNSKPSEQIFINPTVQNL